MCSDVTRGRRGGRTAPGDTLQEGDTRLQEGDTRLKLTFLWLNLKTTLNKRVRSGKMGVVRKRRLTKARADD